MAAARALDLQRGACIVPRGRVGAARGSGAGLGVPQRAHMAPRAVERPPWRPGSWRLPASWQPQVSGSLFGPQGAPPGAGPPCGVLGASSKLADARRARGRLAGARRGAAAVLGRAARAAQRPAPPPKRPPPLSRGRRCVGSACGARRCEVRGPAARTPRRQSRQPRHSPPRPPPRPPPCPPPRPRQPRCPAARAHCLGSVASIRPRKHVMDPSREAHTPKSAI
jgi:hypothetical protein